uniref:Secreted protein n=1 Tax=Macrostomum lignano TaxID=282301 RepID=A0A1I8FIE8_9PLAT
MLLCLANFGSFMASVLSVSRKTGGRRCGCVTRRRSAPDGAGESLVQSENAAGPQPPVVDAVAATAVPLCFPWQSSSATSPWEP